MPLGFSKYNLNKYRHKTLIQNWLLKSLKYSIHAVPSDTDY